MIKIAGYKIERIQGNPKGWHAGCVKFEPEDVVRVIEAMKPRIKFKADNIQRAYTTVREVWDVRDGDWIMVCKMGMAIVGKARMLSDKPGDLYICTNEPVLNGCDCGSNKHGFKYSWCTSNPWIHYMAKCGEDPTNTGQLELYREEYKASKAYVTTSYGMHVRIDDECVTVNQQVLYMKDLTRLAAYLRRQDKVQTAKTIEK